MNTALRMTQQQHDLLRAHLFPGDGLEAVALLLCGRRNNAERAVMTVREVVLIPYSECDRHWNRVIWATDAVTRLLTENLRNGQAIVKVHGHGCGYTQFSETDDTSDTSLFSSVGNFLEDGLSHASIVVMDDGEIFGRLVACDGTLGQPLESIMVVGDDIRLYTHIAECDEAFSLRHAQAYGRGTTALLRKLSVAVIGCSGTGSIVIEQLARLGIGKLVLVDPDCIEERNLNRILNSTMADALAQTPKVEVSARFIQTLGLKQQVVLMQRNLMDRETVLQVAGCDIVFGDRKSTRLNSS